MSRSAPIDTAQKQETPHPKDAEKKVPQVRVELESLMEQARGIEDIDSLVGIVEEIGQYLIHLQWLEQQLLPLITEARARYNNAMEAMRVSEDREAVRLNNDGVAMNRAVIESRLAHSEMRKSLNAFQQARNRYEDEYTDLKGFRSVVEACKMTLHQKIKALMDEYRGKPYNKSNQNNNQ